MTELRHGFALRTLLKACASGELPVDVSVLLPGGNRGSSLAFLERTTAMMAPEVYERARANAPIHVQLWQLRGGDKARDEGSVLATTRVVRIFRDRDHALYLGKRIRFRVPVIHSSGPDGPELGGTIYHDWDRMGRAHWLEAFMQSVDGQIELVRSQIAAIRRPTMHPVCGPDEKGFLCAGNLP